MSRDSSDIPWAVADKLKRVGTLQHHLAHPSISLVAYSLMRRFEVADRALSRYRIYLDTKYMGISNPTTLSASFSAAFENPELWNPAGFRSISVVGLRDASRGRPAAPHHSEILSVLTELVKAGKVWCPLSYDTFAEWQKQEADSRMVTARIMDLLCGGIMVQMESARVMAEISHFVWTHLLSEKHLIPVARYMWLPVGFPTGEVFPTFTELSSEVQLAIQKSLFDVIQSVGMSEIALMLQDESPLRESDEHLQRRQNIGAALHRFNCRSFDHVFQMEVDGTSDLWVEKIEPFAADLLAKGHCLNIDRQPQTGRENAINIISILTAGLKLKRISTALPCMHIHSSIHAAIRWSRQRYRKGDLHDHHHAIAALPYFDAFLTDRKLAAILRNPLIDLSRKYNCQVFSDDAAIVRHLKSLF